MKGKILSLVLAVVLCVGVAPTAGAYSGIIQLPDNAVVGGTSEDLEEEQLVILRQSNSESILDITTGQILTTNYRRLQYLGNGLFSAYNGERYGIIDRFGRTVAPFQYFMVGAFHDGLAQVETLEKRGTYEMRKEIYVDIAGRELVPAQGNYVTLDDFDGGVARITVNDPGSGNHVGLINTAGQIVVPAEYFRISDFHYGVAPARKGPGEWGLIDNTGRVVLPLVYDMVRAFQVDKGNPEQLFQIQKGHKWGLANAAGEIVVPPQYLSIQDRIDFGLVVAQLGGTQWGVISAEGEVVPMIYDGVTVLEENVIVVRRGEKCGFLNRNGQTVLPLEYDDFVYSVDSHGLINVKKNGKCGKVDRTGKVVIPVEYDSFVDVTSGGFAKVEKDGVTSYIDLNGNAVTQEAYNQAVVTQWGLHKETAKGKCGLWDGITAILPAKYDDARELYDGVWCLEEGNKQALYVADALAVQPTATPSTQTVTVDGKAVTFEMYALGGGSTNYIRVRDLAALLNGTAAQFDVGWDGKVALSGGKSYTGTTASAPFSTVMPYSYYGEATVVNGEDAALEAIQITYNGGGYTYFKLRDLGQALGFNVGWSADKGVYIETDKPYDANN